MTKNITNFIFYAGLIAAIFFGADNKFFHIVMLIAVIQLISFIAAFITQKRNIPCQVSLHKPGNANTGRALIATIVFTGLLVAGLYLLDYLLNIKYVLLILAISFLSLILQYLLLKNTNPPYLLINNNRVFINELFIRSIDIKTLKILSYNGFAEKYVFKFADYKTLEIYQYEYQKQELEKFITAMLACGGQAVQLSDNIKNLKVA
jgi:hypothetical protein